MSNMMTPREAALLVAIQGECDHAARNDMRLGYSMDKSRSNVVAVPESLIHAAIDGWKTEHGVQERGSREELAATARKVATPEAKTTVHVLPQTGFPNVGESFTLAMELRVFVTSRPVAENSNFAHRSWILQQRMQGNQGSERWIDVPVIYDDTGIKG